MSTDINEFFSKIVIDIKNKQLTYTYPEPRYDFDDYDGEGKPYPDAKSFDTGSTGIENFEDALAFLLFDQDSEYFEELKLKAWQYRQFFELEYYLPLPEFIEKSGMTRQRVMQLINGFSQKKNGKEYEIKPKWEEMRDYIKIKGKYHIHKEIIKPD